MMTETEAEFQKQIIDLARWNGWTLIYHPHDSRRSAPGFPDLVLVRPGQIIFAELKTARGRVSREQREWLDTLRTVQDITDGTVSAYLWRPDDWDSIVNTLSRKTMP